MAFGKEMNAVFVTTDESTIDVIDTNYATRARASALTRPTASTCAATTAIKTETNFAANEAEFEQLGNHTPVVAAQVEAVARVSAEARALVA
jgi:hypothetical protein